ncbi:MAG: PEP-CTERM sorting domain-containing protein [Chromatiales bacterium]|jgi:hypothetical protein
MFKTIKVAFVSSFLFISTSASAVELLTNGGFETGDFTGWTATDNVGIGITELIPWTVSGPGGGYFGNSSPLSGSFSALNGFDGDAGLTYGLYQDVAIPVAQTAIFTTNHRIEYDGLGITSSQDRIFEITIRDLANSILSTLYTQNVTLNGAPSTDLGWQSNTFDISAFSGQTVRIYLSEFIPEDYTGPATIEFDDISLDVTPAAVPVPAPLALLGLGLLGLGFTRRKTSQ